VRTQAHESPRRYAIPTISSSTDPAGSATAFTAHDDADVIQQTSEIWMKLAIHELATAADRRDTAAGLQDIVWVSRILEQLTVWRFAP
jgi:tryptophan 2,3-dioxygenase